MGSRQSKWGRLVGTGFGCLFGGLFVVFVVAEIAADPGGAAGAGLALLVVAPLVGLTLFAWFGPSASPQVIRWLVAVPVALAVWFAVDPGGWRGFENAHGPVLAITIAILVPALALLGWRQPLLAGQLLVALGLVPVLARFLVSHAGSPSLLAVCIPALIDGLIFLFAASSPGTYRARRLPHA